ncbi:hypothetical protein AYI69_g454 [Smittium culicis]|uniref:Uncharacterized protein n=1 Tax=Smittium culicis TaxID=133412 RepID=A0A1R1YSZ6_9FUNG|nr:hypothetical protein AYI69_g454 [Smittium culicis]
MGTIYTLSGCRDKPPRTSPWNWPVNARDCTGNAQKCNEKCNTPGRRSQDCFLECERTWKCNSEDAPVSYMEVDSVNEKPKYLGFNITYSGKIPGTNDTAPPEKIVSVKDGVTNNSTGKSEKSHAHRFGNTEAFAASSVIISLLLALI